MSSRKIEVVPPNPEWKTAFEQESPQIAGALGENVAAIHHIGSTAIPQIYAKPIIDVLVEVKDITQVNQRNEAMQALGYQAMGEFGLPGRRFFYRDNAQGIRTHHVHTFTTASSEVKRHLAFRDYMIAHPIAAQKYSDLKRKLAQLYSSDIDGYANGKHGLIKEVERWALEWRRSQQPEEFKCLEEGLLQPQFRRSPGDLATFLADDFIEFGSSGRIFDRQQAIAVLQQESTDQLTLVDFQIRELAVDVVLTTYQAVRHNQSTAQTTTSLRSSIWKFLDGHWQVVFHQGTTSADSRLEEGGSIDC